MRQQSLINQDFFSSEVFRFFGILLPFSYLLRILFWDFFKQNSEIRVGFMPIEIIFSCADQVIFHWNILAGFEFGSKKISNFFIFSNGIFRFG